MIDPALYDQARDRIARTGFTSELQTVIALTLGAAKNGNLAFHNAVQWLPQLGVAQQFLISQAARELEAVTLLTRTTQWSASPEAYSTALRIAAPLTLAWSQLMISPGTLFSPQSIFRGLSLGHAQLSRLRLMPIIPEDIDPLDAFVIALRRIEQENGRMLQTQIRLLKNARSDIQVESLESVIEHDQQMIDQVFSALLSRLAN